MSLKRTYESLKTPRLPTVSSPTSTNYTIAVIRFLPPAVAGADCVSWAALLRLASSSCLCLCSSSDTLRAKASSGSEFGSKPRSKSAPPLEVAAPPNCCMIGELAIAPDSIEPGGMLTKLQLENTRDGTWRFHSKYDQHATRSDIYQENPLLSGYWVRDFSAWPIRSGRFGHGTFRSRGISVRLWHLAEILHVHFLTQTCLHQQKVLFKKTTNIIQDPTVNQHQHMIFIIISKQIKSLSTFCN